MDEYILQDVKLLLGLSSEEDAFDKEVMILVNAALVELSQLGMPEFTAYPSSTWRDYMGDANYPGIAQALVYSKVQLAFDPPVGSVLTALESLIREHEWRLTVMCSSPPKD